MESTKEDIKPTIAAGGNPDKSSHTVPGVSKLKQSRYEDVWSEDVHAAFMEAVVLYPPMGKRRLKYYRVSTRENEHLSNANRARSFGRCQLIQSYILEKTGKDRSRKQVSSHLQRLKKIHKDNPTMHHLFSERSHPPSEDCIPPQTITRASQDTFTFSNDPVSMCHLKSDPDCLVSLQNTDIGAISSSAFSSAAEASSFNGGSCNLSTNFRDQTPFSSPPGLLSPVSRQCPAGNLHPSNSDYFSELQNALLFKDAINEGFRSGPAFNTSAFSISMCRLAPKLPIPSRLVDSSPATQMHFSRAFHTPGFRPTNQCISHDSLVDSVSCSSALAPGQGSFYTPFFPLPMVPPAKQRVDPGFVSEWMWPKGLDITPDLREGSFDELHLRYPPAVCHASCPDIVNSPMPHISSSGSETSQLAGGFSCPYKITTSAAAFETDSNEGTVELLRQSPETFQNLASPLVIRPTPVYPVSYGHASIQSANCASAPSVFA